MRKRTSLKRRKKRSGNANGNRIVKKQTQSNNQPYSVHRTYALTTYTMTNQHQPTFLTRLTLACILCATGSASADTPSKSSTSWAAHVEQFLADYFAAHPDEAAR